MQTLKYKEILSLAINYREYNLLVIKKL